MDGSMGEIEVEGLRIAFQRAGIGRPHPTISRTQILALPIPAGSRPPDFVEQPKQLK
jgi:hypothetical protein